MAPAPVYLHDLTYLTDHTTKPGSVEFNHYLMQKYGPTRLLTGGVHVGYSLQEELIESLYERFGKAEHASLAAFKNYLYFKLAQGYIMWQCCLPTYSGPVRSRKTPRRVLLPELDHQVRRFPQQPVWVWQPTDGTLGLCLFSKLCYQLKGAPGFGRLPESARSLCPGQLAGGDG